MHNIATIWEETEQKFLFQEYLFLILGNAAIFQSCEINILYLKSAKEKKINEKKKKGQDLFQHGNSTLE